MFASCKKSPLIDLEALQGDRAQAGETVQRDRLSEGNELTCRTCGETKEFYLFFQRGGNRKGFQGECRECQNKRAREYRQRMRDYVGVYKMDKGCEVCGFQARHPCQLDLDHIDPKTKTYKGSHKSYDAGWSKERVDLELAKCVVTCKNCHALRTYKEGHWKNEHTSIRMRQSGLDFDKAVTEI